VPISQIAHEVPFPEVPGRQSSHEVVVPSSTFSSPEPQVLHPLSPALLKPAPQAEQASTAPVLYSFRRHITCPVRSSLALYPELTVVQNPAPAEVVNVPVVQSVHVAPSPELPALQTPQTASAVVVQPETSYSPKPHSVQEEQPADASALKDEPATQLRHAVRPPTE
jgi:hypothetical protein